MPPSTRKTASAPSAETKAEPQPAIPKTLEGLRVPFPAEAVGKLPRGTCRACRDARGMTCTEHDVVWQCPACGGNHSEKTIHLDYVGHADVTARLLDVDPQWTWRPFSLDEMQALPPALREGLWIHLTVLGVTRPGFGDASGKHGGDAVKEMVGDAIRNAAMRFGVALQLWAKGDREWAKAADETPEPVAPVTTPMEAADDTPGHQLTDPGARRRWAALMGNLRDDLGKLSPGQSQAVQLAWRWPSPWEDAMSANQVKDAHAWFREAAWVQEAASPPV